jgi:hypothetical protein
MHKSVAHKNKKTTPFFIQARTGPVLSNCAEHSTPNLLQQKDKLNLPTQRIQNKSQLTPSSQVRSSQCLPAQTSPENNYAVNGNDISVAMSRPGHSDVASKSGLKTQKLKSSLNAISCRFCSTFFKTFLGYIIHTNERHKATISKSWKACNAVGCSMFFPSSRFDDDD